MPKRRAMKDAEPSLLCSLVGSVSSCCSPSLAPDMFNFLTLAQFSFQERLRVFHLHSSIPVLSKLFFLSLPCRSLAISFPQGGSGSGCRRIDGGDAPQSALACPSCIPAEYSLSGSKINFCCFLYVS